ncbi:MULTISPECIES: outer membrane beta-barrel protein [unclassified Polaribacter]|uniref:outer membrane beta-barrel protein n=1 Tax=unclassified Polaribacter TaxID=196858 RepID=UPI0011BE818D|nr:MULTISPECIES: outer membrane beta-barrel protein [unclassified Polaribacter]TXD51416.1 outer membrane beta-barrel protein [Polaribacter sp. IC063]TXD57256.1 outer membrane beta-barrel protein [Polaribacter sp. IC066]
MKKIILTLLLASSIIINAQEEDKGTFTLSGSVDVYGTSNLKNNSAGSVGILYGGSGVANGFGLGMANTIFAYQKGKAGVIADLAFGPRAASANAYEGAINQLYAYYKASDKVTFTLGQFNTWYGYEVISPVGNFNYSVSYLFNAGPFSHTGFKLDYAATDDLSFMLAVTNPHGITAGANPSKDYQLGFQTGYKGQYFNLAYGADGFGDTDVLYLDYTGGFDISDSFYFGINAAYANSSDADAGYQGFALYLQNTFSDTFSAGFRPEFFTATSGAGDTNVAAFTLSGNISLTESLKFIPEIRYDTSDDMIIPGFPTDTNMTGITLAAVYSF